jgi:hypothetical protein
MLRRYAIESSFNIHTRRLTGDRVACHRLASAGTGDVTAPLAGLASTGSGFRVSGLVIAGTVFDSLRCDLLYTSFVFRL